MTGFELLPKKLMQLAEWISGQESSSPVMSVVGTLMQPRIIQRLVLGNEETGKAMTVIG